MPDIYPEFNNVPGGVKSGLSSVDEMLSGKTATSGLVQQRPGGIPVSGSNGLQAWLQQWKAAQTPTPSQDQTSTTGSPTRNLRLPSVSYDPKNPNATLADITRQNNEIYNQVYVPVEDQVISELSENNITAGAKAKAEAGFDSTQARNQRGLSRYGIELSQLQQREFARQASLSRSLTVDAAVNDAELAQRERDDNLRNELINIGRGVAQEAQSSFSDASALQTQREANNAAGKASQKAAGAQMIGTAASAAILFFAGI